MKKYLLLALLPLLFAACEKKQQEEISFHPWITLLNMSDYRADLYFDGDYVISASPNNKNSFLYAFPGIPVYVEIKLINSNNKIVKNLTNENCIFTNYKDYKITVTNTTVKTVSF